MFQAQGNAPWGYRDTHLLTYPFTRFVLSLWDTNCADVSFLDKSDVQNSSKMKLKIYSVLGKAKRCMTLSLEKVSLSTVLTVASASPQKEIE